MFKRCSKTRILFCMNRIIMGGLEKVLCQYLSALSSIPNIEVSVISRLKVSEPYFIDFFEANKIKLIDDFCYKKNKFLFIKIGQKKREKFLWKKLNLTNDIFIDFANFSCFEQFKWVTKKKFAWWHGSILFFQKLYKNKDVFNNYDKVVCLSESFKLDLTENNSGLDDKITCVYNPIDVVTTRKLAAEKTFIESDSPYFVAVQRLDEDKDVATIINGFNQYAQIDKKTKLYIVGDGPHKASLMKLAQNNPNIIFTGQINNPYPLIKNAVALILSSTKKIGEGLPNTLLEAQALGTLAISSDVKSGVREILLNGDAGLLFEAENPQSLAEKLAYAKEHSTECHQKKQVATENLYRFSVENVLKKFMQMGHILKELEHV